MSDAATEARRLELIKPAPAEEDHLVDGDEDHLVHHGAHLPSDWWESRSVLAHVRQAAHHRARSGDALLAFVLARVAAATPPSVALPAVVGSRGSLNFAAALIGPPGVGKSSSKRLGSELVPLEGDAIIDDLPVGSGEGLIESYFELVDEVDDAGKLVKVKRQTREAVFAYVDEGQALAEIGGRKGSTLLPTLRSAWTGDTLGQANASQERNRRLPASAYRLGLVVGYQPDHAAALLADAAGGTPQRFLWLSADDPSVPYDPPPWPGPLDWHPPERRSYGEHTFDQELTLPEEVVAEVRSAAIARTRGEAQVDTLDAHHDLGRLKVAGLLALLDSRIEVTVEDWQLAGEVMTTSSSVRQHVLDHAAATEHAREEAGHRAAIRREYAIGRAKAFGAGRRMAEAIGRHVHRGKCEGGCRRRCLTQATRSTDRKEATLEEAIGEAEAEGWIFADGDLWRPGETRPA